MPNSTVELLLLVASPLIALLLLMGWVGMAMKRTKVVNIKLNFLGLSLTARSCSVPESDCAAMRRSSDTDKS